jgi:CHASE2 domain-containing sensor protein
MDTGIPQESKPEEATNLRERLQMAVQTLRRKLRVVPIALVALFLSRLDVRLEHTEVGGELNRMMYRLVQGEFEGVGQEDRTSVVILDISDIRPEPWSNGHHRFYVTPRPVLRDLVEKAAGAGAVGIGVDVDLSPHNGRPHPDDMSFFTFCKDLSRSNNIPICLGVYRTQAYGPNNWLGTNTFSELAASIAIPDLEPIPRRLPRWVQSPDSDQPLPGLSAALVLKREQLVQDESLPVGTLEETKLKKLDGETKAAEFLLNVNWLQKQKFKSIKSKEFLEDELDTRRALCYKHIVLLGDASRGVASDMFVIPGIEEPIPGVFLHACGVATLKGSRVREFTEGAQNKLDLVLFFVTIVLVLALQCGYVLFKGRRLNDDALEKYMTRVTALVVLIGGFVIVVHEQVIWNGFLIYAGALLVHPYVAGYVAELLAFLWNKIRKNLTETPSAPEGK